MAQRQNLNLELTLARTTLWVATAACLSGCGSDPKSDFLSFKSQFVAALQSALSTPVPFHSRDPGTRTTIHFVLRGDDTYDLQKTESLVSPFVGVIDMPISSAKWGDGNEVSDKYENLIVTVASQDGHWTVTKVAIKSAQPWTVDGQSGPRQMPPSTEEVKVDDSLGALVETVRSVARQVQGLK